MIFKERVSVKLVNGKKIVYTPIKQLKGFKGKPPKVKSLNSDQSICHCGRKYNVEHAKRCDHAGFCKKKCLPGYSRKKKTGIRIKEDGLPPIIKRQLRQKRRVEKKTEKIDFYWSDAWRELRYKILRKFGFKCMACGMKPPEVILHVDHIKPRFSHPELELNADNLQVLCEDCNKGKRHYFDDDLRPK